VREVSAEVVDLADKAREIERVMARRGETDPGPVEPLVTTVVDSVRSRFDAAVTVDLPAASVTVPGRGLLEPALENVIENAAEHNDADQPRVDVTVRRREGDVEFRVTDNGPGIPPQERAVLLEGTETALTHGSGLGLWLVYWSVESLDGEVVFEDNHPRGSVVSLCVPVADAGGGATRRGQTDGTATAD
jgi:signal transduction histidine kinase